MPPQPGPIPEPWRKAVLRVLQRGRFHHEILIPKSTGEEWETDSYGAFVFDVRYPLIDALSHSGIESLHVPGQPEPGETHAFWMFYQRRRFFAKICLHPGKITIKILSAHHPLRGDELYPTDP